MDKYAVDLDKVLNDFEYSELTVGAAPQHLNSLHGTSSQRPPDLYKLKNPPVKHTINNVFQSLNEYLSTDIGANKTFKSTNATALSDESIAKAQCYQSTLDFSSAAVIESSCLDDVGKCNGDSCPAETILPSSESDNLVVVEVPVSEDKVETESNDLKTIDGSETLKQPVSEVAANKLNQECEACEIADTALSQLDNVTESAAVVGFDNNLVINESELHQYLDELEIEYESKANGIPLDDVHVKSIQQTLDNEVATKIPEVEVTVTDVEENADVNNDSGSVTACDVDDSSSLSRPCTLEINNQTPIDLVGEPGSTPYNNMYSSNTLAAPEVALESDTETSPSASPTFSDVSTDTVGSTATTESATGSVDDTAKSKAEEEATVEGSAKQMNDFVESSTNMVVTLESVFNNNVTSVAESCNIACESQENANANAAISQINVTSNETENTGMKSDDQGASKSQPEGGDNAEGEPNRNHQEVPAEQNSGPGSWLGKQAPLWIPDSEALNCLHCDTKFTVIKRRHHCRACGLVLCSKCCNMKYRLEYMDAEARVCLRCYDILNRDTNSSSGSEVSPVSGNSPSRQLNQPNPNNPMEYCSMVPPLQQVSGVSQNPPTVMVPVGVLKRKGSAKSRTNKSVMFCDGIRPGSELTNLDNDFNYSESRLSSTSKKGSSPPPPAKSNKNVPALDAVTKSFIPNAEGSLPPTVVVFKSDISYTECANNPNVVEMLRNEPLTFALQGNLHVHVKIINMDCCINKWAWCFSTEGMITVGQDELVLLLELIDNEKLVPKDVFTHLNHIYNDAKKGSTITEYGISMHPTTNFFESKNHSGFLYIRPTFQCLQGVIVPKEPYLVGILIHRWEMPWAKIFPLRLILRLGAEYRYYPSPIISTRHRESVFVEIGHTIINLLADFRNFSYTLPNIRGLTIHMEEKNTTVTIPSNRYDQVMKSLNNSSDHILAFGGNFSLKADSHLVCIQDTHGNNENTYTTHAINIHSRPRKVTGASFIVFNGALKSSSGLTAKSSIVEDGLMIQIPPEHMVQIRENLRNMKNHMIQCGCVNVTSDETVNIVWGENDTNFNVGVQSPIDNQSLSGIPSIRVHNGKDYVCNSGNRMIRWTEVFILENGEENAKGQDIDFSKLAESISKATCQALVKYLDLLSSNNFYKIGIRVTLHVENVSYSAGSNGMKLPPIYMKSLDNELIPVLHRITSNNLGESAIVLELVFHILNV